MRVQPRAPTPDEELFYQEWLGPLWLRYRTRFGSEPPGPPKRFEWHSALYPLWLAAPRLWRPLAVVVAIVAVALNVLMRDSQYPPAVDVIGIAIATVFVLCWWPVIPVIGAYVTLIGEANAGPVVVAMLAASAGLGALTPAWIVAEARRCWARHRAAAAAGAAPRIRAVREPSVGKVALFMWLMMAVAGTYFRYHGEGDRNRRRMYAAAMKSDLYSMIGPQASFRADSGHYAASVELLETPMSVGVTLRVEEASETGWSAVASHSATTMTCGIFVGSAAAPIAGAVAGQPRCARRPR